MILNLLSGATDKTREFGSIGEAALYALLGFLVVFAGIIFLIFVVWLVGKIMTKTTGKTVEKPQPKVKEKVKPQEKPVLKTEDDELSEEAVIIITAAIMAYYEQNNPKCEFTVKRIKRI